MNCIETNKNLLDYLDKTLASNEKAAVDNHLSHCGTCQHKLLQELNLRSELQNIPAPQIDQTFKQNLLAQIEDSKQKTTNRGFWQGFGVATAASFMIWMFVGINNPFINTNPNTTSITTAAVNELKNIRLAFNSPSEFKNVTMVIELPEFAELQGYEGQKVIRWNTSLSDGKNILTLPLILKTKQQGQVVAKLIANNKTKIFRIPVNRTIKRT